MKVEVKIEIDIIEKEEMSQENLLEDIEDYCWSMDNQVDNIDVKNVSCSEVHSHKN